VRFKLKPKKDVVIFDLDGTLALIDKRRELATKENGKINWKIFHDPKNIKLDVPNIPVVRMAQIFSESSLLIVIFSGRSDTTEAATRSWLDDNDVPHDSLIMRPHRTRAFTPDEVLKKGMLDDAPFDAEDVMMVIDDRQKVVDMWRGLGMTCAQVAPGDF
jgi:hypothetical protein